jgi:pilus assembly protein Flp/PilA
MNQLMQSIRSFAVEEDGAQIVEYALIIALVSIALALALAGLTRTNFDGFIGRVGSCLMGTNCQ